MPTSRLFLAQYGQASIAALRARVAAAKATDPLAPVTVVAPSGYAGIALRRSLATPAGLLNVRFMVLARLVEYLGSPSLAGQGRVPLTPLAELAAVRSLAAQFASGPLATIAHHPNLHLSLRHVFRELRGFSPELLERLSKQDTLRHQLILWYQAVAERLSARFYTQEEVTVAASAALADGRGQPALRDLGTLIFYLPAALSTAEVALAGQLAHSANASVLLALTGEEEADAPVHALATRLMPAFGAAQRFQATPQAAEAQLVSASDVEEEARWVTRQVLARARTGMALHRMAVFYRQGDPYASLLTQHLRRAGIPIAGPDPAMLAETPAGRLLTGALDALDERLSREAVMRWIAEAPVHTGHQDAAHQAALWDQVSRDAGVVEGAREWLARLPQYSRRQRERLAELSTADDEPSAGQLAAYQQKAAAADGLLDFIKQLIEQRPPVAGSSWQDFCTWATGLLENFARDPSLWPAQYADNLEQVHEAVAELASLDAATQERCDLHTFRLFLDQALSAPAGRAGATGAGLFLAPLRTAVGMDFDLAFIVGMAEGAFPPGQPDNPLIPDHDRETLQLPGARHQRRIEERRSFLAALAAAQEHVFTYSRSDQSAHQRRWPAPWLLEQAARLHGKAVASDKFETLRGAPWLTVIDSAEEAAVNVAPLPADAHDYDVASIALWRRAHATLDGHALVQPDSLLKRAQQLRLARRSATLTEWDGLLSAVVGDSRRLALPTDGILSPTRLERWAGCPQRYFLGDVLNLAALESPEETQVISPAEAGSLVHRALERFFGELLPDKAPAPAQGWSAAQQDRLLAIAAEEFVRAETLGITGRALLWSARKRELEQDLLTFLEEDARWRKGGPLRPHMVEHRFGIPPARPPVTLPLANGSQLRFRGYIDRVDLSDSGTRAWVIDYKTGSSYRYREMDQDPLRAGTLLQLPIYALAVRQALPATVRDVQAGYWFISQRGRFERKFVPLSAVEARFKQVVTTISSGIAQGIFPANPGGVSDGIFENCRFCDFQRICPTNRDELWQRKQGDPVVAPYLSLANNGSQP